MKRLLIVSILCTFSFVLLGANEKVVDRSARRAPDWLYGMQKNYIITTAEGSTIDIARDLAMQSVKERILTAVAEHVESEARTALTETTHNGDIETLTIFSKQIASHSAYIPFLNDVSEAHAEDYYWEKIQKDKNTFYYRYNIKYPFSSVQIRHIIAEFKQHETDMDAQMQAFSETDFATFTSVEQMLNRCSDLRAFTQSLPAEDARTRTCEAIQDRYRTMLGNLRIHVLQVSRNQADVQLCYGTKPVVCLSKPRLKSNCLTELRYVPFEDGQGGRITYNYDAGCYDDEQNYLNISFSVQGKNISEKIYIK